MTVLRSIVQRSIEDPTLPLTSQALVDWMTSGERSLADVAVTEKRVYGITAYFRGIALMSSTMAGLPLKVYRNGTRERITQRTVLDNPNPRQTPFEYRQTMYANAIGWGNGYARKIRDRADRVVEVWPLHPSMVTMRAVKPTSANHDGLEFDVRQDDGTTKTLTSWDVYRMPYLAPNGVEGMSPLRAARESLGVGIAAENQAGRFYGQGTHLSGILTTKDKLDENRANRLKQRWREKHTGGRNSFDIAVMDNDAKFVPISISPADAQLLESRKYTVVEIARMLGIPPHLLGDVERSTSWGTGIEQQMIGFVKFTLGGWLSLTEQRDTRELLPGGWSSGSWYAEHALEGLLRGDSAARAAFYALMIQWGVFNRNECRVLENLEPAEGLDEYLTPSNMTLISVDGTYRPLAAGSEDVTAPDAGAEI